MKYHKVLLSSLLVILLLGGYASALTLQEAKTIASTSEQGDVVLSWNPGNPWPGELVERDDGTTLWMETNFWNVQSGSGENYMRFIDSTDEVVFYVNMTNVVTNWGGNAFATPNVIFVGRLYKKDHYGNIVWGDKPPVGGYDWFSLPIKGDQVASYDSIWAEVDFELAKSPETLARTGIIMWFEDPGEMPLGEVYIAFSDDYGGIVNTQYPPTDIGTLTETVYINGKPAEITFTVQRTWNWDHFVLEFIPDKVIPEGKVLIDIKPFAQAAVQGIVDDPYSDWTADQITWTSIGFGTYTGSNSNAFEIGWVLHDARLVEAPVTLEKIKAIASAPEPGDVVLQWEPYWWCTDVGPCGEVLDQQGVLWVRGQWPGKAVEKDDGKTMWLETNFWAFQPWSPNADQSYMRFVNSTDEVVFYVNMNNVALQDWPKLAWATPEVIIEGRAPAWWWGGKPPVGGHENFTLPMSVSNISSYEKIWVESEYDVVRRDDTLVRFGIILWFENADGSPAAEVYIPFFDDYGGLFGTDGKTTVGDVNTEVRVKGQQTTMSFKLEKGWNWNDWAFEFLPEQEFSTSGKVAIDIKPLVEKVIQELNDPTVRWTGVYIGSYSGGLSKEAGFEYGWILHDAKITPVLKTETEEEQGESSSERARRLMFIGYFYHYQYNKLMKSYTELFEKGYGVDESILNTTEYFRKLAEENYQKALEISPYLVYGSLGDLRSYSYLRKAYVYIKSAEETLEKAVEYSELLSEYEVMLAAAKDKNVDESVINEAENARMEAEEEYQLALSLPAGDPAVLTHVDRAHELMKSAVELLRNYVTSLPLLEIRELAAEPQPGDVQFTWWDQFLESPIDLSDGRTVWMQTNFWNIVGGEGEVFMRFVKSTEDFAFYVNLDNVQTQWGGIAWATPEVIFAGRPPKVWWGDKPPVGGHEYLSLPMPASEVSKYNHIWIKADYKVVKREDSLVRFGLLLWFENADGWPVAEVYIPFFDDFGGLVGVSDKTTVGQVTSDAILNGEIVSNVSFKLERGWNPGGWWSFEFIPEEELPSEGIVTIDIKPMIDKVLAEFVNQDITWTSISIGSYSGSSGTGFSYGWIIRDVRIVPPEEVQVPN